MDDEPEVIRQQMEVTRTDLTSKIEALENHVVGTVQNTTQAVSDTVESVKEAVQDTVSAVKETVGDTVGTVKETMADTVSSVKEALDVRGYVEQYPWASFGVAVATGFVGGVMIENGQRARRRIGELHSHGEVPTSQARPAGNGRQYRPAEEFTPAARTVSYAAEPVRRESWIQQLSQHFGPEIEKLKGLALGALGALVRDVVSQTAPGTVGERLTPLIDDVTRKLGGEPIRGPLLSTDGETTAGKSSRDREAPSEARPRAAQAW
jgi:ElaB/YqjD/DUF883 family membrane-anchored ribosome-binding protein